VSADAVLEDLRARVAEWRVLFHDQPGRARDVVKQLIVGRLEMTPNQPARLYTFEGIGTM
jgi:hypothetical protein